MRASSSRRRMLAAALVLGLLTTLVPPPVVAAERYTPAVRVVPALAPLSTDAAIDADGFLHVAYLEDRDRTGLMYATNRGGWHKELVRAGVGFEAQPSIAVDAAGHVRIAFARISCPGREDLECDDPISRIHLAGNAGGSWRVRARSAGPDDVWPSLAMVDGHVHIAFQRQLWPPGQADSGIWYLTDQGGWHESQVASGEGRCFLHQIPSIAVAPSGRIWIAYEAARSPRDGCAGSAGIRVATGTGGSWSRGVVTRDRDDVQPVLALDPLGRPGLVFDRAGEGMRFTRLIGGAWTALWTPSRGSEGDLVFDPAGRAHVVAEFMGVQVAVWNGHGFSRTNVYTGPVDDGTYGGPAIVLHPATGLARILFGRSELDDTPMEDELGVYLSRERP